LNKQDLAMPNLAAFRLGMLSAMFLGMIELHLVIQLPRRQKRALLEAFQSLAKWARAEQQGCFSAELFVAASAPCCLCYVETWKSENELRQMIRSQHFSQLIALMELASKAPAIEFRGITETRGLEFAAEVRDPISGQRDDSFGFTECQQNKDSK
jgi:quinol monooxygenase YgiN